MQNDIIDTLRLDITKSSTNVCLYVRLGDTRTFEIFLTNNGNVVDLTNALFAAIYIEREKDMYFQTVVREGNKLRYTLHDTDVAKVGEASCRIVITFKDGIQITSPSFAMIVESIPAIPGDIKDQEEADKFTGLTTAVAKAEGYAESANMDAVRTEHLLSDAEQIFENIEKLLESSEELVNILNGIEPVTLDDLDDMWDGTYVPPNEIEEISDEEEEDA